MLYGRWRSRHRVKNIESQGEEKVKNNKRRVAKNTRMQDVNIYLINMKLKLFKYFNYFILINYI